MTTIIRKLARFADSVLLSWQDNQDRRALAQLNTHLLRDIGQIR